MKLTIVFLVASIAIVLVAADKRKSIVSIAKKEVGTREHGNNCQKYNKMCAPWCSFFATWVWRKAGINIPQYGMARDPYIKWGAKKKLAHRGIKGIKPGDLIFYSKSSANNIYHIGICVKVYRNGNIDTIEGNSNNKVSYHKNMPPKRFFGHVRVPK